MSRAPMVRVLVVLGPHSRRRGCRRDMARGAGQHLTAACARMAGHAAAIARAYGKQNAIK
jgi:hypothetical protein